VPHRKNEGGSSITAVGTGSPAKKGRDKEKGKGQLANGKKKLSSFSKKNIRGGHLWACVAQSKKRSFSWWKKKCPTQEGESLARGKDRDATTQRDRPRSGRRPTAQRKKHFDDQKSTSGVKGTQKKGGEVREQRISRRSARRPKVPKHNRSVTRTNRGRLMGGRRAKATWNLSKRP